jgi:hypothetical protein
MSFVVWTKTVCHDRESLRLLLESMRHARINEIVIRTMYNSPYGPPAGVRE